MSFTRVIAGDSLLAQGGTPKNAQERWLIGGDCIMTEEAFIGRRVPNAVMDGGLKDLVHLFTRDHFEGYQLIINSFSFSFF